MTNIADLEYERSINLLIPMAMREAFLRKDALGKKFERRQGADHRKYNHCFITQFFHEAMNRLAIEAGLRTF